MHLLKNNPKHEYSMTESDTNWQCKMAGEKKKKNKNTPTAYFVLPMHQLQSMGSQELAFSTLLMNIRQELSPQPRPASQCSILHLSVNSNIPIKKYLAFITTIIGTLWILFSSCRQSGEVALILPFTH